jgi:hypothetical protein
MSKPTRGRLRMPKNPEPTADRPDREGKTMLGFYVPKAAHRMLMEIGLGRDPKGTNQDMLCEALNDFFRKNGRPPIA